MLHYDTMFFLQLQYPHIPRWDLGAAPFLKQVEQPQRWDNTYGKKYFEPYFGQSKISFL